MGTRTSAVGATRELIPLGQGVYTVTEACRILQPTMTRTKVHYWLNTGLLSEPPVAHAGKGTPTLLTFRQLLELRTVQYLRDELEVSLPKVRAALEWVLQNLFSDSVSDVHFELGPGRNLIVTSTNGDMIVVHSGQMALSIDQLNAHLAGSRQAWQARALSIPGHPSLVANAHVANGSPTITGTRVSTAVVASFAPSDEVVTEQTVDEVLHAYPYLGAEAVRQAFEFEGLTLAA